MLLTTTAVGGGLRVVKTRSRQGMVQFILGLSLCQQPLDELLFCLHSNPSLSVLCAPDLCVVVQGVVGDRVSKPLQMNTDLMCPSCHRPCQHDGSVGFGIVSEALKDGRTCFAVWLDSVQR